MTITLQPFSAERSMIDLIEKWPARKSAEIHCSNCLHAVVTGEWPALTVTCEKKHGIPMRLGRLIRPGGYGFAHAANCEDFASMGPLER